MKIHMFIILLLFAIMLFAQNTLLDTHYKTLDDMLPAFEHPPADFRPAPLWVWHDKLDTERLTRDLEDLKDKGFGGAFMHPRYGLITEYLSDEWFDMVFAKRGPLGHNDRTLREALRVLRVGGLLFVETPGDFGDLCAERERFERHGVALQILALRTDTLLFDDAYGFTEYLCAERAYLGTPLPSVEDVEQAESRLGAEPDDRGRVAFTRGTIWIGGSKT